MPRRDFDEDDDFDDRPRRPRRRKQPAGPPVGLLIGLGAGALVVGLVGLVVVAAGAYTLAKWDTAPPPTPVAVRPVAPAATPPPAAAAKPAPAPAGQQQVTITGVRRGTGFAGQPTLLIDYTLTGGFIPGQAVVLVKSPQGTSQFNIMGLLGMHPGADSGTWTLEKFGFGGGFAGRLEVWVEQRLGFSGGVVSNTFVLD